MRKRIQSRRRKIVICLVEQNRLAANYLRGILRTDPNVEILPEGEVLKTRPACGTAVPIFAIDVDTLSGSLVNYLLALRARFFNVKTLLLSGGDPHDLPRLPFLGVQGFVSYNEVKGRLGLAIKAISEGNQWFAPELLNEFLTYSRSRSGRQPSGDHDIFTPRERVVVGLVQRELGNKEIAAALHISQSTVKFHLSNIFTKLGVRDRHSAAGLAPSDLSVPTSVAVPIT